MTMPNNFNSLELGFVTQLKLRVRINIYRGALVCALNLSTQPIEQL
jgi:hypothetical protein